MFKGYVFEIFRIFIRMKFVPFLLFIFTVLQGSTQQEIDSLENLLNAANSDQDRISAMSALVDLYGSLPEAELYLKSMLDLGDKVNGKIKDQALRKAAKFYLNNSNNNLGIDYLRKAIAWEKQNDFTTLYVSYQDMGKWYQKNYMLDSAIFYYQNAEEGFAVMKDFESLVNVLNKQGVILKNVENYGEALEKYYKAYDIAQIHQLDKNLASTCINIGVVFKKQDQLEDAMQYYQKAEKIFLQLKDHIGLANAYNNMGNIYRIQDEYQWALSNYKKAIKYRKLGGSEKTLSYSYNNIALVYKEQLKFDSTLYYLGLSEDYKIKLEEFASLASTYLNFADTYASLDDSVNFMKYHDLAMEYALKYNQYSTVQELNIIHSSYAAGKESYQKAYELLIAVIHQMDTLSDKEQKVLSQVLQAKYNDKQKQDLIFELQKSLQEKEELTNELSSKAQLLKEDEAKLTWLVIFLVVVSVLLIIALLLMVRSFRLVKQGASEYEIINRELSAIKTGVEEKEMMLKEIHHRVKNNLQVVKSLIRLQREATTGAGGDILTEFENRVSSIALVHESLHGSIDLTKVDVKDYYERLIQDLIDVYSVEQQITSKIHVDRLSFGLDTLIPLGLLTNEIVSNALKHGFRGRKEGRLEVNLKSLEEETYLLEIADDGIGMHEDYLSVNSLGLELIDTLVGQLDGTKQVIIENGTKYIIKFKNQDKFK